MILMLEYELSEEAARSIINQKVHRWTTMLAEEEVRRWGAGHVLYKSLGDQIDAVAARVLEASKR